MTTWLACLACDTVWRGKPNCFLCGEAGEDSDGPQIVNQYDPLREVVVPGAALLSGWCPAP